MPRKFQLLCLALMVITLGVGLTVLYTPQQTEAAVEDGENSLILFREGLDDGVAHRTGLHIWEDYFVIDRKCENIYYEANGQTGEPAVGQYEIETRKITEFALSALPQDGKVYAFHLSPDGTKLAMLFTHTLARQVLVMDIIPPAQPRVIYTAPNSSNSVSLRWMDEHQIAVQDEGTLDDVSKHILVNLTKEESHTLIPQQWEAIPPDYTSLPDWEGLPGSYAYRSVFGYEVYGIHDDYTTVQLTAVCR